MPTAFLFPGQGSQYVGMAADLYDALPEARTLIDAADRLLDFPLKERMFGRGDGSDAEALKQTDITQPALFVHSLAAAAALRARGQEPDMAAGHSLGEYSALTATGALGFEEGLRLVRLRSQLMARAGDQRPGAMAAVLNLDPEAIERVCAEVSREGHLVQPANFNAPGQVVISGDAAAVEAAVPRLQEAGARRVLPLPVSGAFHSPLMEDAIEGLSEALRTATLNAPRCPVYLNVTGKPTQDPDEIRARLLDQLTAPVLWAQTLEAMQADGADRFVEVGAGNVLSGLVKRTLGREVETVQVGTADQFESVA